jgi:hypothetical protein
MDKSIRSALFQLGLTPTVVKKGDEKDAARTGSSYQLYYGSIAASSSIKYIALMSSPLA